jgi:hypothetical protein
MDSVKNFFTKKSADRRFKKAGEGSVSLSLSLSLYLSLLLSLPLPRSL